MATPPSPREVFHELVHGVSERRLADLPGLYAEQTHVEHPMAPLGAAPLRTREELREHFQGGLNAEDELRFEPAGITVHETTDPEVVVAEFEYRGTVTDTGRPFAIPCVFVLRVRDGQIVASRDYIDHLGFARARGRLDELVAAMKAASPAAADE